MHFNEQVAALNRDSEEFDRDAKAQAKEVESFFAELERVALRTR
jgi:hypothetical protein